MKLNLMTKKMTDRMFEVMADKNISTSYLCKILNVKYPDFTAMCQGKHPCYGKWQKKISEVLEVDRRVLFYEFFQE